MQMFSKPHPQAVQVVDGKGAPTFRTTQDTIAEINRSEIELLAAALEGDGEWDLQEETLGEKIWELDASSPSEPAVYTLRYRPSDNGYALLKVCLVEEEESMLCDSYPNREAALRGLAGQLLKDAFTSGEAMQELRDMHPLYGCDFL
jgi:hypothetical protein